MCFLNFLQQMKKLLIFYKQLLQMGKATEELLKFLRENKNNG